MTVDERQCGLCDGKLVRLPHPTIYQSLEVWACLKCDAPMPGLSALAEMDAGEEKDAEDAPEE